jgi:hypothetical protein
MAECVHGHTAICVDCCIVKGFPEPPHKSMWVLSPLGLYKERSAYHQRTKSPIHDKQYYDAVKAVEWIDKRLAYLELQRLISDS